MLAAMAIGLGLALGLAAGGSVTALRDLRLRGELLIVLLFVVQALIRDTFFHQLGEFAAPLWGVCSFLLLILLSINFHVTGVAVSGVGVVANLLVVQLNRGMPVVPPPGVDEAGLQLAFAEAKGFYVLADARTSLTFLGDVLPTGNGMASLGDLLLVLGVVACLTSFMCSEPRLK